MSQYQQLLYQDSPVRWDWGQEWLGVGGFVGVCLKLAAWSKQFAAGVSVWMFANLANLGTGSELDLLFTCSPSDRRALK